MIALIVRQVTLSYTSPFKAAGGVYSAFWSAVSPVISSIIPLVALAVVLALFAAILAPGASRRRSGPPVGLFLLLAGGLTGGILYWLWTAVSTGNYFPLAVLAAIVAAGIWFSRKTSPPIALSRGPCEDDAQYKGRVGEAIVQAALKGLSSKMFIARHNLIVPSGRTTTEIDSVVFSYSGVFVIETKNWGGKIYGREDDARWTMRYGKKQETPLNPLRQNEGHMEALRAIVGAPPEAFHSIVVVSGGCEFPKGMPRNVIRPNQLRGRILSEREAHFSGEELDEAVARVDAASDKSPDAAQRHVESVQARRRH